MLLDLNLPDVSGLEGVIVLRSRLPEIPVDTVRAHVVEILSRLGACNRTEAVMLFFSGQFEVSK